MGLLRRMLLVRKGAPQGAVPEGAGREEYVLTIVLTGGKELVYYYDIEASKEVNFRYLLPALYDDLISRDATLSGYHRVKTPSGEDYVRKSDIQAVFLRKRRG